MDDIADQWRRAKEDGLAGVLGFVFLMVGGFGFIAVPILYILSKDAGLSVFKVYVPAFLGSGVLAGILYALSPQEDTPGEKLALAGVCGGLLAAWFYFVVK